MLIYFRAVVTIYALKDNVTGNSFSGQEVAKPFVGRDALLGKLRTNIQGR